MTVRPVTVVGAGTIGLGWTVLLLSRGRPVRLVSRRPEARDDVAHAMDLFHDTVPGDKLAPAQALGLLETVTEAREAIPGSEMVLENTPDDPALKQHLLARWEPHLDPGALLLSSTSKLLPDLLAAGLREPGRLVVGHPFNPPHLVPLVEVLAGSATTSDDLERALDFYRGIGQKPVVLHRALPGFAVNRLQAALLRECIHLVHEGVVSMSELDEVVTQSIGLRWAAVGPFEAFHLGGGPGGLRKWLGSVEKTMPRSWAALGQPDFDAAVIDELSTEAERVYGSSAEAYERLSRVRDERQKAILEARGF